MPASLLSLKIRGVRSYSHLEHKSQTIDFMPLTLIVGSNGHGKTTLIESLKFVISGEEPPLSDSRRNFLHTSKSTIATKFDKKTSYASIELEFQNANGQICLARREIFQPSSTAKSATPAINSGYRVGKGTWNHVHKQDDWSRTIPLLFNLPSQAMLNNVILCHQEENLWCMGDSLSVKQIFDKIFGCESYKKEIKNIDSELKNCRQDLQLANKELVYQKEKVERKKELLEQEAKLTLQVEEMTRKIGDLDHEVLTAAKARDVLNRERMSIMEKRRDLSNLKCRIKELCDREKELRDSLRKPPIEEQVLSSDELEIKIKEHSYNNELIKSNLIKINRSANMLNTGKIQATEKRSKLQSEINALKVTEMKSQDTLDALAKQLDRISLDQSLAGLNSRDLESSFKILEEFEQTLRQVKCDKSEQENKLSREQQSLLKDISKLESAYLDLMHRIKSKEKFVEKLIDQLAQSDPVGRDLVTVAENLNKISKIAEMLPETEQVESLRTMAKDSSRIIDKLVIKIQKEGVAQIKGEIDKEKTEIEKFRENLVKFEQQKEEQSKLQSRIEDEYSAIRAASKEAHNKMITFNQALQNLKHSYVTYKNETKLLATKDINSKVEEANKLDEGLVKLDKEIELTGIARTKLCEESTQSFELLEEYKTNIQLRQAVKQVVDTKEKLRTLEQEVGDESHFEELKVKLRESEGEVLHLHSNRSRLQGSKLQISSQLDRIVSELSGYSRTNSKYAEVLGTVVCNTIIMSDLEKLKVCFTHSITTFHNQMIVKINEALRARWKQIYKGSDIRYIELVDEEIKRGDKKGFNYYIAMYKDNLKMKMREKSSAGQKALASIILRMTLAELFVKDFTFIALDEPTSNLDLDNVLSLAKAIGSYVKRRATRGTNIQWIIITHDEKFLRALDAECSPYYYKVQLDSEGCSKIVKISYQDAKLESKKFSQESSG